MEDVSEGRIGKILIPLMSSSDCEEEVTTHSNPSTIQVFIHQKYTKIKLVMGWIKTVKK